MLVAYGRTFSMIRSLDLLSQHFRCALSGPSSQPTLVALQFQVVAFATTFRALRTFFRGLRWWNELAVMARRNVCYLGSSISSPSMPGYNHPLSLKQASIKLSPRLRAGYKIFRAFRGLEGRDSRVNDSVGW
jgi:hypothetical protein